jgi:hypothetical protein
MISVSPLGYAFKACKHDAFEYLLSFHSPGGKDGPDLLPPKVVNSSLAIFAEYVPDWYPLQVRRGAARKVQRLPLQERLDAAGQLYERARRPKLSSRFVRMSTTSLH